MAKGLNRMLKEAQKLEKRLEEVRRALGEMTAEGTAGGGAVRVTMNGHREVVGVSVSQEVLEGADSEMIEDLLLSALRDAKQKCDEMAARETSRLTGGILPPGSI